MVKNTPASAGDMRNSGSIPGWGGSLERGMATHSSVLAWRTPFSQAISRCSGRNFCQFVNYYRIKYSVDVFRQNPKLKVAELALQCGFNSAGSFSSAFKLYMNESPSDWMRQERSRIIKCKHPVI